MGDDKRLQMTRLLQGNVSALKAYNKYVQEQRDELKRIRLELYMSQRLNKALKNEKQQLKQKNTKQAEQITLCEQRIKLLTAHQDREAMPKKTPLYPSFDANHMLSDEEAKEMKVQSFPTEHDALLQEGKCSHGNAKQVVHANCESEENLNLAHQPSVMLQQIIDNATRHRAKESASYIWRSDFE